MFSLSSRKYYYHRRLINDPSETHHRPIGTYPSPTYLIGGKSETYRRLISDEACRSLQWVSDQACQSLMCLR